MSYIPLTFPQGSKPINAGDESGKLQVKPYADKQFTIYLAWAVGTDNTRVLKSGILQANPPISTGVRFPQWGHRAGQECIPENPISVKIKCLTGQIFYARNADPDTTNGERVDADRWVEEDVKLSPGEFMGLNATAAATGILTFYY